MNQDPGLIGPLQLLSLWPTVIQMGHYGAACCYDGILSVIIVVNLTAGDLAFLKALHYQNTDIGPTLSREDIQLNMMRQLRGVLMVTSRALRPHRVSTSHHPQAVTR